MYDRYAALFFKVVPKEPRPYEGKEFPASIVSEKHLVAITLSKDAQEQSSGRNNGHLSQADQWKDYDHEPIRIPIEYKEANRQIDELLENPLLPSGLVRLLEDYKSLAHQNVVLLQKTLIETSREMPEHYRRLEDLKGSEFHWIHNRFNGHFQSLKPKADEIISFVRSLYGADHLMKA